MPAFVRYSLPLLLLCCALTPNLRAEDAAPPAAETQPSPASSPALLPRPPLPPREQSNAEALQQRLPPNEQQSLQADAESFLALWQPANQPKARGLVILLPDPGASANWPRVIAPLRLRLPDAGWASLSLNPPDAPDAPLQPAAFPPLPPVSSAPAESPAAPAASDAPAPIEEAEAKQAAETPAEQSVAAQPEGASAEVPPDPQQLRADYGKRLNARLQAALTFAASRQAGEIVLLGHGESAWWAAEFIRQQRPAGVTRLLLIDARQPADASAPLEELLPQLGLPVGDFFHRDDAATSASARLRLLASKREAGMSFTQVALVALPGDRATEQEQLFRRIRGWLDKTAAAPTSTTSKPAKP